MARRPSPAMSPTRPAPTPCPACGPERPAGARPDGPCWVCGVAGGPAPAGAGFDWGAIESADPAPAAAARPAAPCRPVARPARLTARRLLITVAALAIAAGGGAAAKYAARPRPPVAAAPAAPPPLPESARPASPAPPARPAPRPSEPKNPFRSPGRQGSRPSLDLGRLIAALDGTARPAARTTEQPAPAKPAEPAPAVAADAEERRVRALADRIADSVAFIKTPAGTGSGFVVRKGIVATNAHVIAGPGWAIDPKAVARSTVQFLAATNPDPNPLPFTVLYADCEQDVALLRVETDRPPLPLAAAKELVENLEVVVVGNPGEGLAFNDINHTTSGHYQKVVRPKGEKYHGYLLDLPVRGGNSGGPAVSARSGAVIGIVSRYFRKEGSENGREAYCMPAELVRAALAAADRGEDWAARAAATSARMAFKDALKELAGVGKYARDVAATWEILGNGGEPIATLSDGGRLEGSTILPELQRRIRARLAAARPHVRTVIENGKHIPDWERRALIELRNQGDNILLHANAKRTRPFQLVNQLRYDAEKFERLAETLHARLGNLDNP